LEVPPRINRQGMAVWEVMGLSSSEFE
jgi:hypothetical protein